MSKDYIEHFKKMLWQYQKILCILNVYNKYFNKGKDITKSARQKLTAKKVSLCPLKNLTYF